MAREPPEGQMGAHNPLSQVWERARVRVGTTDAARERRRNPTGVVRMPQMHVPGRRLDQGSEGCGSEDRPGKAGTAGMRGRAEAIQATWGMAGLRLRPNPHPNPLPDLGEGILVPSHSRKAAVASSHTSSLVRWARSGGSQSGWINTGVLTTNGASVEVGAPVRWPQMEA